jgi:uncharacterized protein YdhG (YjbR/CyaY superfamily)
MSSLKLTVDMYISRFPTEIREQLEKIRKIIINNAPNAEETISYNIPTFDMNGKHLVHFAGFKKHIGFFPTPSPIVAFKDELSGYKTSKGTIQFPLDKPIPYDLIEKIVKYRVEELSKKETQTH